MSDHEQHNSRGSTRRSGGGQRKRPPHPTPDRGLLAATTARAGSFSLVLPSAVGFTGALASPLARAGLLPLQLVLVCGTHGGSGQNGSGQIGSGQVR